ncbi:MAG: hypothetical protein ACXWQR_24260, partial [Ktedonobacterales bacterium]
MATNDTTQATFPANWQIAQDYDPNEHTMQLKGKAYLDVQNRMIWFLRDQRNLIVAGLAKTNYVVQTEMVEHDKDIHWANFKTYVRDVLGNEATMYGSESSKDFGDYLEKASTKSLGRALAMLGYGTQFAPEMDEGERVVDSPVERKTPPRGTTATTAPASATTRTNTAKRPPAPVQPRTQPTARAEQAQVIDAALDANLNGILVRHPDLKDTYLTAKQYGLTGVQFFTVFADVAHIDKKQPITVAHKEKMVDYVARMAADAQAAAARTPDL